MLFSLIVTYDSLIKSRNLRQSKLFKCMLFTAFRVAIRCAAMPASPPSFRSCDLLVLI